MNIAVRSCSSRNLSIAFALFALCVVAPAFAQGPVARYSGDALSDNINLPCLGVIATLNDTGIFSPDGGILSAVTPAYANNTVAASSATASAATPNSVVMLSSGLVMASGFLQRRRRPARR